MAARANFSCQACAKSQGVPEVRIPNLPAVSKRCPFCGHARGFRRLFDAIQVSTKGHRAAKFIDAQMQPAFDKHGAVKSSAKAFEAASKEAMARAYEAAPPTTREAMAAVANGSVQPGRHIPAAAALGAIPHDARRDTREVIYPAMTGRHVRPLWTK